MVSTSETIATATVTVDAMLLRSDEMDPCEICLLWISVRVDNGTSIDVIAIFSNRRWKMLVILGLRKMDGCSVFCLQRLTCLVGAPLQIAKHNIAFVVKLVVLFQHLLLNQEVAGGGQGCKPDSRVDLLSWHWRATPPPPVWECAESCSLTTVAQACPCCGASPSPG